MSLIERLRDRGVLPQPCAYHDKAMLEAATQLQAYEAKIERLRDALQPFADHANIVDADGTPDMDEPDFQGWSLLAGDFRRARASLDNSRGR